MRLVNVPVKVSMTFRGHPISFTYRGHSYWTYD